MGSHEVWGIVISYGTQTPLSGAWLCALCSVMLGLGSYESSGDEEDGEVSSSANLKEVDGPKYPEIIQLTTST